MTPTPAHALHAIHRTIERAAVASEVEAKAWAGDGTEVTESDRHHYVVAELGPQMDQMLKLD